MARSSLLPYAFVWAPYICMGKMLRISNDFANFIWSFLGAEEWKIAKMIAILWPRWPPCPYMVKPLKIFFSRTEDTLGLNLCTNHWGSEVYQSCSNDGRRLTFDLFTVRLSLLPYVFCMGPIHLYGKNVDKFQMTPPLKPLDQCCSNFMWSLLGAGERKIAKMITILWPRWPPCFVLRFYGPVNPMGSCRAQSVYLTTHLLGRLSSLWG